MMRGQTLLMLYASAAVVLLGCLANIHGASAAQEETQTANTTTITKKLFTYTGPLLPSDWSLVSILNDRAVIGFSNGSARNALLDELDPKDKSFLLRLQNGTVYSTPLASAKEKIAQWSSSVTSTVTKFGKSFKDQFDSLVNNRNKEQPPANLTMLNPLIN